MGHDKRFSKFTPRTTNIYGNCLVLSDTGTSMFRCLQKKADWYLSRNLAKVVSEDPYTIQLTFKPKAEGWNGDPYYLSEKMNVCVQCGEQNVEFLTKHHIVPYAYRKFMPIDVKNNSSIDIVVLCVKHHFDYELKADDLKTDLAKKHDAPIHNKMSNQKKFISRIVSATKLKLYRWDLIPEEKKTMVNELLLKYFGNENYTNDDLVKASCLDYKKDINPDYEHAEIVMSKTDNLQDFVVMWREHFLEHTKPQFLPEGWDLKRSIYRQR